jgi:hypothetical protein
MWEPQPLATLRASTACTGITLPSKTILRDLAKLVMNATITPTHTTKLLTTLHIHMRKKVLIQNVWS